MQLHPALEMAAGVKSLPSADDDKDGETWGPYPTESLVVSGASHRWGHSSFLSNLGILFSYSLPKAVGRGQFALEPTHLF